MRRHFSILLFSFFLTTFPLSLCADEEAKALLRKVDELYRSESSMATMTMTIVTPNWQRSLSMQSWTVAMDDTFIRILTPKKDRGVATLKKDNQMWNYFPKINKVIKVPPSMMMGSWMGSDFTNDDLVREVSLVEEYDVRKQVEGENFRLTLIPREETVTVWARIEITITQAGLLPIEQSYFNEKGEKVRSMWFENVREFSGKKLPATMRMVPQNKEGYETVIEYQTLEFNKPVVKDIFTLRNLKTRFR